MCMLSSSHMKACGGPLSRQLLLERQAHAMLHKAVHLMANQVLGK